VKLPQADQNNGTSSVMQVDRQERAFLMFDLSGIPADATVNSATLKLCLPAVPGGAAKGRTHELRTVSATWTELGVTWNTQPGVAADATSVLTVPATAGCISADVTVDVQAWVSGKQNYGWRISDRDEANAAPVTYATREEPTIVWRPALDVLYVP